MWLILCLICLIGSVITYQDFKFRAVVWIVFPMLLALGIAFNIISNQSPETVLVNGLINAGFLAIQLFLLWIYFHFWKNKTSITKNLGWGDILFLFACCSFFAPLNFLLFYILSLFFSLMAFLLLRLIFGGYKVNKTVPLAGLQSVFLIIFLLLNLSIQNNVTNDNWILSRLHTL